MNIVITGAGSGIGFELSKIFSLQPENKIVAISRRFNSLNQMKEELSPGQKLTSFFPIEFDLEDIPQIENLQNIISEIFPSIDILINNAGFLIKKDFLDFQVEDAVKLMNINFFAPSFFIRSVLPLMGKGKNPSHVINISSMGGFQGSQKFPGLSFYSASKAALACLTECLAAEIQDKNIRFNTLCPGSVQTKMLEEAFPDYKAQLSASEMADFIYQFAINGSKFFNGKIIPVSLSNP
jgi:short-subunit dehydrogenase